MRRIRAFEFITTLNAYTINMSSVNNFNHKYDINFYCLIDFIFWFYINVPTIS